MKEVVLVDTGIIVEYLRTGKGVLPSAYESYEMVISAATFTELLASKTFEDEALKKEVLEFCDKYFSVKDVTSDTAMKAAEVLRTSDVTLATAFLAATALENGIKVLTDDEKKFSSVQGLSFLSM
ncbi:MAG: type II toxin-antitoxin system VapC family toxin [Candidatus Dojkabacteria bacterium]